MLLEGENNFTEAERLAGEADNAAELAAEHIEALNRANSAAHAASASHAGQPCPVCDREPSRVGGRFLA
jgi:hypothetical protein